jgi:hypothetical protein
VPASAPNFSPYPFDRLRRITRADAALESQLARWLDVSPARLPKLAALAAGPVTIALTGGAPSIDPHASLAEVRLAGGASILVAASSIAIRTLAQQHVGGPEELPAPRPLTTAEQAIWCLVLAAALADLAIDARVWPAFDKPMPAPLPEAATVVGHARAARPAAIDPHAPTRVAPVPTAGAAWRTVELAVKLGPVSMAVVAFVPRSLALRVPPARAWPRWTFDIPIVLARSAVERSALARLAIRDIITVERTLELEIGDGRMGLHAAPRAVEATVATGYVRRDMTLPDDAHLELTVQLGTTRMSLRALSELAVGQIVSLGRPLAGPFEVRAAGRLVGQGELVDVDGELGVRIVSLAQE